MDKKTTKKISKTIILREVKKFKEKLRRKYDLDKLILFGSYAKGKYHSYSDVDLVIISKDFEKVLMWTLDTDIDFLCYTPKEAKKYSKVPTICRTALSTVSN